MRILIALLVGLICAGTVAAAGFPDPRAAYRTMLKQEAERLQLPFDIADAVVTIESGYDPTKIGSVGEIGLMQVRPATAAMLGFKGSQLELARPEINIHYGVTYLAGAWQRAGGDLCRALMKYRAGHGQEIMTPLSALYCSRAAAHLQTIASPYATRFSPLTASATSARAMRASFAGLQPSRPDILRGAAAPPNPHGSLERCFLGRENRPCPRHLGANRTQMAKKQCGFDIGSCAPRLHPAHHRECA